MTQIEDNILILDIETTGTNPIYDYIIEIGAVSLNTKTFEITDQFHSFICETQNFNKKAWIFLNSDITVEMILNEGKLINDIRDTLQHLLNSYQCTAFNCKFDFNFLKNRNFKIEHIAPDPMYICTHIFKILRNKINSKFQYHKSSYNSPINEINKYKWPKVTECLEYFKINEIEPHRALQDARLEAKIIIELLKLNKYN
ncbi:MAG: 3'-5' exonuclease [Acidithiobacillus sp.]|jgi:DNA polymerase-3 subunit alpha (Gram-positive type)|uniref:3'-5' exonuclease n=1 Tax=Acidithiobacillus sp. TaxID=1872118 RepID=UPI00355FB883